MQTHAEYSALREVWEVELGGEVGVFDFLNRGCKQDGHLAIIKKGELCQMIFECDLN